ncbi:hypothetical protein QJS10_CPB17g00758 [Acorus calamus]|uniref:Uncharacterized protein n=1 Tax=Acorus calamus TaxID=4465 RepID=A0AAV9CS60_ACOCL|nr:hypothetical protein QJS10_CPB17g00758 [Acorus calamus]
MSHPPFAAHRRRCEGRQGKWRTMNGNHVKVLSVGDGLRLVDTANPNMLTALARNKAFMDDKRLVTAEVVGLKRRWPAKSGWWEYSHRFNFIKEK